MSVFTVNHWQELGLGMTLVAIFPFVALLLMIAVLPLIRQTSHGWEKNSNKLLISGLCGLAGLLLYLVPTHDFLKILHTYLEYAAFIALLASLFIASGGIHISGSFAGLPYINTIFMAIGALLANVMGTTGASMILIRPLIRANRARRHKTHIIIFFIFIVSNCAGLLTPLGDPPLYLGFLRGVPFDWTLRLMGPWAFMVILLLFIFHILDERMFAKEDLETKGSLIESIAKTHKKLHIEGWRNVFFTAGIILTIVVSGYFVYPALGRGLGEEEAELGSKGFQILVMGILALLSYRLTPRKIHKENEFSFAPIQEVAALFFGIFGAMIPALAILEAKGKLMGLSEPWQFFWATGTLSSFLDNAPTYLTFVTLAAAKNGVSTSHLGELAAHFPKLLAAISCAAVFMGANTYIGNGPNFMVKAIAEHARIKMPSFGAYMLWSGAVLTPLFLLATWIFF